MYVCSYIHKYTSICIYIYVYTYICIYIYVFVYIHICRCIYEYVAQDVDLALARRGARRNHAGANVNSARGCTFF